MATKHIMPPELNLKHYVERDKNLPLCCEDNASVVKRRRCFEKFTDTVSFFSTQGKYAGKA